MLSGLLYVRNRDSRRRICRVALVGGLGLAPNRHCHSPPALEPFLSRCTQDIPSPSPLAFKEVVVYFNRWNVATVYRPYHVPAHPTDAVKHFLLHFFFGLWRWMFSHRRSPNLPLAPATLWQTRQATRSGNLCCRVRLVTTHPA